MANLRKTLQNRRENSEENLILNIFKEFQKSLTLQKTEKCKITQQLKFLLLKR